MTRRWRSAAACVQSEQRHQQRIEDEERHRVVAGQQRDRAPGARAAARASAHPARTPAMTDASAAIATALKVCAASRGESRPTRSFARVAIAMALGGISVSGLITRNGTAARAGRRHPTTRAIAQSRRTPRARVMTPRPIAFSGFRPQRAPQPRGECAECPDQTTMRLSRSRGQPVLDQIDEAAGTRRHHADAVRQHAPLRPARG